MGTKLMNVEAAAKYLGMSQSWLRASKIPIVHLDRRRMYRQEDLDAYVDKRVRR